LDLGGVSYLTFAFLTSCWLISCEDERAPWLVLIQPLQLISL
jgi:hypothetical protein